MSGEPRRPDDAAVVDAVEGRCGHVGGDRDRVKGRTAGIPCEAVSEVRRGRRARGHGRPRADAR